MQPGQFAWQVFDSKIIPMLRDEYRIKRVTKVRADTLEELVRKLDDVDAGAPQFGRRRSVRSPGRQRLLQPGQQHSGLDGSCGQHRPGRPQTHLDRIRVDI